MKKLIISLILVGLASIVSAQDIILFCKGNREMTTDGKRDKLEKTSLNIAINEKSTTAVIEGNWYCLGDKHFTGDEQSEGICYGELPVAITDNEINFISKGTGKKYSGSTSFTINRYSGSMNISSIAIAYPESGAVW